MLGCSNKSGVNSSRLSPRSLVSLTEVTILEGPVEPNGKWLSCVNKCCIIFQV